MLNKEQLQAVETIFGPVLVIAGPGTGKTQVLATRIAEILKKTDTNPKQILALTFTEAGVTAMRNRLRGLIGPAAHSVKINTFHGFCADTISRFPEKFLFSSQLETADDLSRIRIIRSILEQNDFKHLSPFAAPNLYLRDILGKISGLKREAITPDDFLQVIEQLQSEFDAIPDDEKTNPKTGKWKIKYSDQFKKIEKWFELQLIYKNYEESIKRQGLMDFDDQIMFLLNALKTDDDLLLTLQEENLFFLADEFQDSNGAQMGLLELLAGDEANPNLFVVGDDDQSIYRFQGANLENIIRFIRKYPGAMRIPLTANYRSTKQVLDFAEQAIASSNERLTTELPELDKHLHTPLEKSGELPKYYEFDTGEAEQFFVLTKIRELEKAGTPLSEIAVLCRTNSEGRHYLHYFENNELPAVFAARSNVLSDIRVRQLLDLLRLIESPSDNRLFFEVLHHANWQLQSDEIWRAWRIVKTAKTNFYELFSKPEEKDGLFDQTIELAESTTEKIGKICNCLTMWNDDRRGMNFAAFFQKMLTDSGFIDFVLTQNDRLETLNHLNSLFAEVKNLSRNKHDFSLDEFLENIELHEEFEVPISSRMLQTPEEAVRILTAHSAKGLEYNTVFVTNLAAKTWGDRKNIDKLPLPDDLMSLPQSADHANEEERRLFFVAITRAKEKLFLCCPLVNQRGSSQSPSRFLDEVDQKLYQAEDASSYQAAVFDRLKAELLASPKHSDSKDEALIKQIVTDERFALSSTAFENYKLCPRKFLYENVLRVPGVKAPAAALGSAMHKALEIYFGMYARDDRLPQKALLIKTFEKALEKEILTGAEHDAAISHGTELLNAYHESSKQDFIKPLATEMDFFTHHVRLQNEVPLTGKIDKVEPIDSIGKSARVIDYKTAKPKSSNMIMGHTKSAATDPLAGSMYRQLQFYSILTNASSQFKWHCNTFRLDFLKPDARGKFINREFIIEPEDTKELEQEIINVWQQIQNLAFLKQNKPCSIAQNNRGECEYCKLFTRE